MRKRVNIYPRRPITSVNPPIRSAVKGVTKDVQDIRKCIVAGAKVEEVINSSTTIVLNLNNYDRDNGGDPNPIDVRIENAVGPIVDDDESRKPLDISTVVASSNVIKHEKKPAPAPAVDDKSGLESMPFDELFNDTKTEITMSASELVNAGEEQPEVKEEVTPAVEEPVVEEVAPAVEEPVVEEEHVVANEDEPATNDATVVEEPRTYHTMSKKERRELRRQHEERVAAEHEDTTEKE